MLADLADLPPTLSTEQAAQMLGCARGTLWAAARDEGGIVVGDGLIRPIRVGRSLRWPSADIARALGLSVGAREVGAPSSRPALTSPRSDSESAGRHAS